MRSIRLKGTRVQIEDEIWFSDIEQGVTCGEIEEIYESGGDFYFVVRVEGADSAYVVLKQNAYLSETDLLEDYL